MIYPLPSYSRFSLFVILSVFLALFALGGGKAAMGIASNDWGVYEALESFVLSIGAVALFGSVFWVPILIAGFVPGYWAFFRVFLIVFALSKKRTLAITVAALVTCIIGWIVPLAIMKAFGSHQLLISEFIPLLYFGVPAALLSATITLIPREQT